MPVQGNGLGCLHIRSGACGDTGRRQGPAGGGRRRGGRRQPHGLPAEEGGERGPPHGGGGRSREEAGAGTGDHRGSVVSRLLLLAGSGLLPLLSVHVQHVVIACMSAVLSKIDPCND
uniref:Uncharacterized protein n=1 Tax=Triticum urartu TaxID=4572 RepID=A0A8R7PH69_TRIUA